MSAHIIPHALPLINPENTCETCSVCAAWSGTLTPVWVNGRIMEMAQCLNSGDDGAPYAEARGPFETAVFTHAESRCPAFIMHPDAEADMYAEIVHRAELDRQLTREAWMM